MNLGSFAGDRRQVVFVFADDFDLSKIRAAYRVLDAAPMRDELRSFLERAAEYTLTPMPAMLRLATRSPGLASAR